jgi:hypothetical protein
MERSLFITDLARPAAGLRWTVASHLRVLIVASHTYFLETTPLYPIPRCLQGL